MTDWKTHRLTSQAAANTLVADADFAGTSPPTVPGFSPIDFPLKFGRDAYFATSRIEVKLGIWTVAATPWTPIGRGTLTVSMELLDLDSHIDAGRTIISGQATAAHATSVRPWDRVVFTTSGPRLLFLRVFSPAGAAAANFTRWDIRWRELV